MPFDTFSALLRDHCVIHERHPNQPTDLYEQPTLCALAEALQQHGPDYAYLWSEGGWLLMQQPDYVPHQPPAAPDPAIPTRGPQPMTTDRLISFEDSPWSPGQRHTAPARRITVRVTEEDVATARWARFADPISTALRPPPEPRQLRPRCSGTATPSGPPTTTTPPAYPSSKRTPTPMNGVHTGDTEHCLPLPTRAAAAMWRLRSRGIAQFQPFKMRIHVPTAVLANTE